MMEDLKFAFIFGETKVDSENKDGYIERSLIDDESAHIEYVVDYLKTHFKDDQYLQNISVSTSPHQVAIYLKDLGHITFYNITSYRDGIPIRNQKSGLLILPDELTENQKASLEEFGREIEDYNDLQIWQNFYRDESGFLNCNSMSNLNTDMTVTELIGETINKNNKRK